MTLIAAFYINNHPVLIGDVLISCLDPSERINIPTNETLKESAPENLWLGIPKLRQKVNVISSNLMIAWCGDMYAAQTILQEIKARSDEEKFTEKSLKSFFENDETKEWIAKLVVGFIGYIIDDDCIKQFKYSFNGAEINQKTIPPYGNTLIAGSGSKDLIHLLEEVVQPRNPSLPKKHSEFDEAVQASLTICAALLAKDFDNIKSGYGGSFEIATLSKKGMFEKLNNLTYFQWSVSNCESSNPKLDLVGKAYKLIYINDLLVVFTLSMSKKPKPLNRDGVPSYIYTEFPIDEYKDYRITPCYKYFSQKEIESMVSDVPIEITSRFNCNFLFPIEYNQSGASSLVCDKSVICKSHLRENTSYIVDCPNHRPSTLIIKNEDLDDLRNSYKLK
jgi:hypothetical protein